MPSPEEAVGGVFLNKDNILSIINDLESVIKANQWLGAVPHNICLLSEDTISAGDTCFHDHSSSIDVWSESEMFDQNQWSKVVATTDKNDNLPNFTNDFAVEFIKKYNGGTLITEVLVECEKVCLDLVEGQEYYLNREDWKIPMPYTKGIYIGETNTLRDGQFQSMAKVLVDKKEDTKIMVNRNDLFLIHHIK